MAMAREVGARVHGPRKEWLAESAKLHATAAAELAAAIGYIRDLL